MPRIFVIHNSSLFPVRSYVLYVTLDSWGQNYEGVTPVISPKLTVLILIAVWVCGSLYFVTLFLVPGQEEIHLLPATLVNPCLLVFGLCLWTSL